MSHEHAVELVSKYLFSSDASYRQSLVDLHPEIFADDVMSALRNADITMKETHTAVEDVHRSFESIMKQCDLPLTSDVASYRAQAVPVPDALISGADPRQTVTAVELERHFRSVLDVLIVGNTSNFLPDEREQEMLRCVDNCQLWWKTDAVVLNILSFLDAQFLLSECENIVQHWRVLLCDGPVAQSFWVGVVQREFPKQLATLVAKEGPGLWDEDWRTIAMLIVCDDEEEND